jgi:EmrB/QacA subfamily drug resistance transporter
MEFPHFLAALPAHPADEPFPESRRWPALFVLSAAMFISAVDMTIVNVALPDISRQLGAGIGELQWVMDGFLIALAGLLLVGSGLADRFGRRRVFLTGFAIFGVASLLAALASTPLELIGARVLMGVGAAGILPPALSLLAVIFPPEIRPRALGIWSTVAGAGMGLGPVIGGVLVEKVGWSAVFLVNVPVAIAVLPAGLALLPESRRPGAPPLDLAGVGLSIVALGGIVFALIESVQSGWTDPPVLAALVAGLAATVAFFVVERRVRQPLFDVGVLRRPRVACGAIGIVAIYGSFLGVLFLLPQYLQYVQGEPASTAGLAILPLGLGLCATSWRSGRVLERLGARRTLVIGLNAMAIGVALLLLLGRDTSIAVVLASMAVVGLFLGVTIAPATAVIMNDLGVERAGDGAAVNQLARQVGGTLGVAIIGSIFAAVYSAQLEGKLAAVPAASRGAVDDSIEDARRVISTLGGELKTHLLARVDDAFDSAARFGFGTAAMLLLVAALVAMFGLPRGER